MNECAFDIRTKDQVYQNKMESVYGLKKTDEDEQFYLDNCSGPCPSSEALVLVCGIAGAPAVPPVLKR